MFKSSYLAARWMFQAIINKYPGGRLGISLMLLPTRMATQFMKDFVGL
jgi:hypothetical protein